MDIARPLTASGPAYRGVAGARLSLVRPGLDGGAMPGSDELNDLLQAVAGRADRQAFAALFKHFAPRIKAYLLRSGTPPTLAEELTQETMVSVWRKAGSFDPSRARLSTWIFTIARNLRIDAHRREGTMPATVSAEAGEAPDDRHEVSAEELPDERLDALRRERGVRRALMQLPAEQVLVLQLSFYEGRPHAWIARELCLPLGTVKSRIRLGIGQLRRLLEGPAP